MFVIRLDNQEIREGLGKALREQGIETGVHYPVPNHLQPAMTDLYGQPPVASQNRGLRQTHTEPADVPFADRSGSEEGGRRDQGVCEMSRGRPNTLCVLFSSLGTPGEGQGGGPMATEH